MPVALAQLIILSVKMQGFRFFKWNLNLLKKNCNNSFAYSYEPSDNFDRSRTKKRLMDDMITIGLSITYNMAIKVIINGNGVYGRREVKEINIIK